MHSRIKKSNSVTNYWYMTQMCSHVVFVHASSFSTTAATRKDA